MPSETIIVIMRTEGDEQFAQAMGRSETAARGAGDATEDAGKNAQKGAKGLAIAAAAATAMYKGYELLKDSVNTTVQLAKNTAAFSRVSGLDAKQSQAWVLVAQERGIQTKTLGVSMATLGRAIGSVGGPTKATAATLQELGVNQQDLIKMPMQERMDTLANAFTRLPNGVNKAALAQKLFGRSGQALLPILTSGAKGLNDTLTEAGKLVPYNKNAAQSALDLAQQQRTLNMAMTGLKVAVGTALLPILTQLVQDFEPLVAAVATLLHSVPGLAQGIIVLGAAFGTMLILSKVNAALEAFGIATMGATPLLIIVGIVALVAALVMAYQKVKWFHDAVNAAFDAIKTVVMAVVDFIAAHWKLFAIGLAAVLLGPIAAMVATFLLFRTQVTAIFKAIVTAVTVAFNAVKNVVMVVVDFIKANWKTMAVIVATALLGPIAGIIAAFLLLRSKVNVVTGAIKSGFEAAKAVVLGVVGSIVSAISSIPKRIIGMFSGLKAQVGRAASGMFDGIKNAMSSAVSFVSSKVTMILNLIKKVIGEVTSLPSKIASPVTSIAGKIGNFASGALGHIPGLQHGGNVTRPGTVLVGERGPELMALPAGASVEPLIPHSTLTHGRERPIVANVYLERKRIAQALASYTSDLQAAR